MEDILSKLVSLEKKTESLSPDKTQRVELVKSIRQYEDELYADLDRRKGYSPNRTPELPGFSDKGKSIDGLLKSFKAEVSDQGIQAASAAHLGYIPGGGIYSAALGDFLAAISNEYAGMYYASPGAVGIEEQVLDWLKEVFGFPQSSIGNLTSGGSIANLIALTAARDKHKIEGEKISRSVVYTSKYVHHCIHKALRIIGLKDVIVREVELDSFHRIDCIKLKQHLEADLSQNLYPFLLIASAGTTDTGSIDPLSELAEIASVNRLWYHIDAAYGGMFALVDSLKQKFEGIEKADSLVVDPHKGLFLPYGVGAVLIKDRESVFQSNHYTANYMQDANDPDLAINPADVSPELSRHFRGLRVWLPLQLHGINIFKNALEEKVLLTQYARKRLIELGMILGPEPDLSVTFFYHPDGDKKTKQLMKLIHEDGDVFLSSSIIEDRFVIRVAILAYRTKMNTIDRMIDMLQRCLGNMD